MAQEKRTNQISRPPSKLYFFERVDGKCMQSATCMLDRILLVNITQGNAEIEINGKNFCLTPQNFAFLPPHSNIHVVSATSDFEACVIGFTMALQDVILQKLSHSFFAYVFKTMVWQLTPQGKKNVDAYCTLYEGHCHQPPDTYSVDIANSLFNIFLLSFYQNVKEHIQETHDVTVNSKSITARFAFLLRESYKQHHTVAYYAGRLCVSSKYLTQIFKSNTGFTPKTAIDRTLGMEALFMLGNTNYNIQQISNELGFPDQSYFGRFFKRLFGISPLAYRNNPDLQFLERLREEKLQMEIAMDK